MLDHDMKGIEPVSEVQCSRAALRAFLHDPTEIHKPSKKDVKQELSTGVQNVVADPTAATTAPSIEGYPEGYNLRERKPHVSKSETVELSPKPRSQRKEKGVFAGSGTNRKKERCQ